MIYEWECISCESTEEITRTVEHYMEPPQFDCKCGGDRWRKVLTSSPVHGGQKGNIHGG